MDGQQQIVYQHLKITSVECKKFTESDSHYKYVDHNYKEEV